jgi:ABC-type transport system involved in multi-copper enzyme maturation permease subunit
MNTLFSIRLAIIFSIIAILVYTFYLIRNKNLSIHLAISWIIVEIVLIVVISISSFTNNLILLLGETNYYSLIFLFIIGWIVSLMLDTLKRVSDVMNKTVILTQENGLLREKIERLEDRIDKISKQ